MVQPRCLLAARLTTQRSRLLMRPQLRWHEEAARAVWCLLERLCWVLHECYLLPLL
jgi:hypothetical protein